MTQHAIPDTYRVDTTGTAPTGLPTAGGVHIPAQTSGVGPPGVPVGPMSPPAGLGPMPMPMPMPMPQFQQNALATPPEPPLNTTAVLSVISAFVISPVAVVLGVLARRQITRSGERGRGLAILGTVLGSVFSLVGIATALLVVVLAGSGAVTIEAGTTSPSVPYSAPAPVPSLPSVPSPAAAAPAGPADPTSPAATDARSTMALLTAYSEVSDAATTLGNQVTADKGDFEAVQQDFADFRRALQTYRTAVAAISFPADQQARVQSELLPAVDAALAQLDRMASTSSSDTFVSAYEKFSTQVTKIDEVTQAVLAA